MLIVGYFFGIRSERRLCEERLLDLAARDLARAYRNYAIIVLLLLFHAFCRGFLGNSRALSPKRGSGSVWPSFETPFRLILRRPPLAAVSKERGERAPQDEAKLIHYPFCAAGLPMRIERVAPLHIACGDPISIHAGVRRGGVVDRLQCGLRPASAPFRV